MPLQYSAAWGEPAPEDRHLRLAFANVDLPAIDELVERLKLFGRK